MKCRFYIREADRSPQDLGTFDFADESEARSAARERLLDNQAATSIDVWANNGELFRIDRTEL